MARWLTTEQFIESAKTIHGDLYDYSKTEYVDTGTKLEIICLTHGPFFQTPHSHYRGQGCPNCSGNLGLEGFLEKARNVHGEKYDYSEVVYAKGKRKIKIICPIHGLFEQAAGGHLRGHGCSECAVERRRGSGHTNETFIERAKEVHGDRYTYGKVDYKQFHTKVLITCSDHGDFLQTPNNHLKGQNCPYCFREKISLNSTQFIEKAKEIHGNKYTYEKVDYVETHANVIITCPDHGDFNQSPANHLRLSGCPSCGHEINALGDTLVNLSKTAVYIDGYLYVIHVFSNSEDFFKIGRSIHSLRKRYDAPTKMPYDYEEILQAPIGMIAAFENEQRILSKLSKHSYKPKIQFGGATECLSVNPIEHDPYLQDLAERYK